MSEFDGEKQQRCDADKKKSDHVPEAHKHHTGPYWSVELIRSFKEKMASVCMILLNRVELERRENVTAMRIQHAWEWIEHPPPTKVKKKRGVETKNNKTCETTRFIKERTWW